MFIVVLEERVYMVHGRSLSLPGPHDTVGMVLLVMLVVSSMT